MGRVGGLECWRLPVETSGRVDWLDSLAKEAAFVAGGQPQPVLDFERLAPTQSGQPADEAVLATAQPGLGRSLWTRGFGGGEFRGSATVPGHLLQSQRLDLAGAHAGLRAQPAGFLPRP